MLWLLPPLDGEIKQPKNVEIVQTMNFDAFLGWWLDANLFKWNHEEATSILFQTMCKNI